MMDGARKRTRCIVKVGNQEFVKYNVTNLVKFALFLDEMYPDWRWFNVYSKETGEQIANYTRNNRP